MAATVASSATVPQEPDETSVVLLKGSRPSESAAVVCVVHPANNHAQPQNSSGRNNKGPLWSSWFRHDPANNKKDQNNYVSVSLTPLDEQQSQPTPQQQRADGSAAASGSRKKWRGREKWLLLSLMILSVVCLAFVAVSLVSILRQGQGSRKCGAGEGVKCSSLMSNYFRR